MSFESPFACVTTDHGLAAEILHVSPIYVRFAQARRGRFADRRLARARRTQARHELRGQTLPEVPAGDSGSLDAVS